jgi:site-specific DNA recombinase
MEREDRKALTSMGFTDSELAELGLLLVPDVGPDRLVDAYIRRSKKREDLATLRAHLRQIVRWAQGEDLTIRHVWFEQKSASKTYLRRDEFENAKAAVLAGRSKTLAAWKTDRFDRRGMGAVGGLLDELDKRGARLVSTSEGLDSSKGGRMVFAFLSERAREEAKDISLRVQIGLDAHRPLGRIPGGMLPYGVRAAGEGKLERHPDEYPTARKIAQLLLEGVAGTTVAHRMTAEGATTRTGRHWSANAVSRMAQSPLWAGLMPRRERHRDEFGQPIDKWGSWTADVLTDEQGKPIMCGVGVVTPAEWYMIKNQFASRTVRGIKRGHGVRAAGKLLTGIMRCPRCGVGLVSGGQSYRCRTHLEGGPAACRGARTLADRADDAVSRMWITHVSALEPDDPVLHEIARRWLAYQDPDKHAHQQHTAAAMADAERRAGELDDAYFVHQRMPLERYERLAAALAAQVEVLRAELAALSHGSDLTPLLDSSLLEEAWEAAELTDRRMLLRCAVDRMTLLPSTGRGDRRPVEDRIEIDWVSAAPVERKEKVKP